MSEESGLFARSGAHWTGRMERSLAVFGVTVEEALALGRRFGQVAIFDWEGPGWSLLACVGDRRTDRGWRWVADSAH